MARPPVPNPTRRDASLRRTRALAWGLGAAAAGLTAAFSAVAAHAFKGHDGKRAQANTARVRTAPRRVSVPGPQSVPRIADDPAPLAPPPDPPAAAPPPAPEPAPAPDPPVSGGS
jgi:hypothetical protein